MLRVRAMQRIGNVLENEGDYAGAQSSLERALTYAKTDLQRASILNDMGWVMMQRGELESATTYAEEAIHLCGNNPGNSPLRAQIFDHLGTIAEKSSDLPRALSYHQQSFDLKRQLGDMNAMAETANNLGAVFRSMEDFDQTLHFFKQSLDFNKQIGNVLGIAMATLNMGNAYADQDDMPNAISTFQTALDMFEKMGHKQGMATSLDNLAACLEDSEDKDTAHAYLSRAYALYQEIGDAEGEARIREVLTHSKGAD